MIPRHRLAISLFVLSAILLSACEPNIQPVLEIKPTDTLVVVSTETVPLPTETEIPEELPTTESTATEAPTATPEKIIEYETVDDVPEKDRIYLKGSDGEPGKDDRPLKLGITFEAELAGDEKLELEQFDAFFGEDVEKAYMSGVLEKPVTYNPGDGMLTVPIMIDRGDGVLVSINLRTYIGKPGEPYAFVGFDYIKGMIGGRGYYLFPGPMHSESILDLAKSPDEFIVGKQIAFRIIVPKNVEEMQQAYDYFRNAVIAQGAGLDSMVVKKIELLELEKNLSLDVLKRIGKGNIEEGEELFIFVEGFRVPAYDWGEYGE